MVWALEWSYPYDADSFVSIWDTQEYALKQACAEIIRHMNATLDFTDEACKDTAVEFQRLIDNNEYLKAVKYWNSSDVNCDGDHSQYWNVSEKKILDDSNIIALYRISLPDEDESEEDEEDNSSISSSSEDNRPKSFVATKCGATCRGCKQYNEYAYADNADDTYHCYSCKSYYKM